MCHFKFTSQHTDYLEFGLWWIDKYLEVIEFLDFLQVLIYSLEKYDEKFLTPQLHSAIGSDNVRSVRVSLCLDTADLAKG